MQTSRTKDFDRLSKELSHTIEATAYTFLRRNGIQPLPITSLGQMTTPISETSRELLMFGGDIWPEGCEDDADNVVAFPKSSFRHYLQSPLLRYAALLTIGVVAGCLSYGPVAQALHPPAFHIVSVHLDTPQVRIGEPLLYTKVSQQMRPCRSTIDRTYIDQNNRAVARERVSGPTQAVTDAPISRQNVIKLPLGLEPGHYTYRALILMECDGGTALRPQTDFEFDLLPAA